MDLVRALAGRAPLEELPERARRSIDFLVLGLVVPSWIAEAFAGAA